MIRSLRSFMISFLLSLVVFAIVAAYIVPFLNTLILDVFNGNGAATEKGEQQSGIVIPDDNDVPVNGNVGDNKDNSEILDIKGETFEILLIVTDSSGKSAEMITFIKADKENQKFVFSAIPANLKVTTGGAVKNDDGTPITLGSVYKNQGVEAMTSLISGILGVKIDYYYSVSQNVFISTINTLGKVPVTLKYDMIYKPENSNETAVNLSKGEHNLDGKSALQYISFSNYVNGELDRLTVQLNFTKLMLSTYLTSDKFETCKKQYEAISKGAKTNLSNEEFAKQCDLLFCFKKFKIEPTVVFPTSSKSNENDEVYYEYIPNNVLKTFESYR